MKILQLKTKAILCRQRRTRDRGPFRWSEALRNRTAGAEERADRGPRAKQSGSPHGSGPPDLALTAGRKQLTDLVSASGPPDTIDRKRLTDLVSASGLPDMPDREQAFHPVLTAGHLSGTVPRQGQAFRGRQARLVFPAFSAAARGYGRGVQGRGRATMPKVPLRGRLPGLRRLV